MRSSGDAIGRLPAAVHDGLFLLNKPAGMTSNRALQKVKRLLGARKAGHTGSLDPAATGMLPICIGEATKVCGFLLDADKTYRVTARLGEQTDTGDGDGQIVGTAPVPELAGPAWDAILQRFVGESEQVPPMYSALRRDGKRLYELARKGESVERPPRRIRIAEIGLLEASGKRLVFRVRCSKGTYVRSLVEDIAAEAGTVAHTASLHREAVGGFRESAMLDLVSARRLAEQDPAGLAAHLLPVDAALADWPRCELDDGAADRFGNGQAVGATGTGTGLVRVYDGAGTLLGIGERKDGGVLAPRRVFHLSGTVPGASGRAEKD